MRSLWDNRLGRSDRFNNVQRVAAGLSDRELYGDVWDSAANETDVRKWTVESHQLAESFAYDPAILRTVRDTPVGTRLAPITLSDAYLKAAGHFARERVVAAGLRLGAALNER